MKQIQGKILKLCDETLLGLHITGNYYNTSYLILHSL